MTERYEDFRRPFDLDDGEEPERAPWDRPDSSFPPRAPAYAAEEAVSDVDLGADEEELGEVQEEAAEPVAVAEPEPVAEPEEEAEAEAEPAPVPVEEHAEGELDIPDGYRTLQGEAHGDALAVAIVVSRFNGEVTNRLLARALEELESFGVPKDAVTIAAVPGAFELPLAAMALAKTRRYGCIVALGCIVRGETAHFEHISSEAASGLQLAALETGTPVSFGVLTLENREQAEARIDRAADAVHSALEMADMFAELRASAGS
jgi:6,7-dimethyl-8-ribityllumazine synthase